MKEARRIRDIGGLWGCSRLWRESLTPSHSSQPQVPPAPLKVPQPPSSGDLIQAFPNAIEGHTGRVDIEYRESGDEGSIHSRTHDNEDGSIIPVPLYETVGKIGS